MDTSTMREVARIEQPSTKHWSVDADRKLTHL